MTFFASGPFSKEHRPASQLLASGCDGRRLLVQPHSLNKNSAILFFTLLVLFLPTIIGTEAQNLHLLPTPQPLQKNFPAVSKPNCVTILVRFSAHLHKRHLLGRLHIKM